MVKSLPANAGDVRDTDSIPELGRSPGGGLGNPFQYSCLENPHGQRSLAGSSILTWRIPVERGAWWVTVHAVAKRQA